MQIISAIVALLIILTVHEGGHYAGARAAGIRVMEVALGWGKRLWSTRRNETDYSINAVPLLAYVAVDLGEAGSVDPHTYRNRPWLGRVGYVFGGPLGNLVFALVLLVGLFLFQGVPTAGVYITAVAPGSPAVAGGLLSGDQLVSVAGRTVRGLTDVAPALQGKVGQPIPVQVVREGRRIEVTVVPMADQAGDARIGITMELRPVFGVAGTPLTERIALGWHFFTRSVVEITRGYVMLFTGQFGLRDLGGPVSIVQQTAQEAAHGWPSFLVIVAQLSINIGLLNLLPLPALDGGRLVFLLIEGVFRVRVREERQEQIHAWGLVALLALMLLITVKDVAGIL